LFHDLLTQTGAFSYQLLKIILAKSGRK